MSMDADAIVDRRRLRRKVSFWRVIAFFVAAVALIALIGVFAGPDKVSGVLTPQVARITISGLITDDRNRIEMIDRLARTDTVKAVIVSIDSGGGTTTGGEAVYEALRRLSAEKPTVAELGTVAASAAYMTAIATDHIVARRTSLTGSIGVLFEYPDVTDLIAKLGIKDAEIKSAPLKAEPSPFHPASEEAKAVIAGVVDDTFQWFVNIVAERRGLSHDQALALADGRVFTGNQALAVKLVDELGGEEVARAWLEKEKGIAHDWPVRDWKPESSGGGLFSLSNAATLWFAKQLGFNLDNLSGVDLARILPEILKLDGLKSVWHASIDQRGAEGAMQ